jgi:hypothetical protein
MRFKPSVRSNPVVGYGEPITLTAGLLASIIGAGGALGAGGLSLWGQSKQRKLAREQMAADAAMQQQMLIAQQQQAQINAQTAQAQAAADAQTVKYAMFGLGGLVVAGILYKMWSQSDSGEDDASDEE